MLLQKPPPPQQQQQLQLQLQQQQQQQQQFPLRLSQLRRAPKENFSLPLVFVGVGHPRESKKMTEGRRSEFVSNVVLGVEEMQELCHQMLGRLGDNFQEMDKLYVEFQLSEKGSSWEEDDCVKGRSFLQITRL